jgi:hypothetical protein
MVICGVVNIKFSYWFFIIYFLCLTTGMGISTLTFIYLKTAWKCALFALSKLQKINWEKKFIEQLYGLYLFILQITSLNQEPNLFRNITRTF